MLFVTDGAALIEADGQTIVLPARRLGLRPSLFKRVDAGLRRAMLEADPRLGRLHDGFVQRSGEEADGLPSRLFWAEVVCEAVGAVLDLVEDRE